MQQEEFDKDTYKCITSKEYSKDNELKQAVRLKTENTIRWRNIKDQDGDIKVKQYIT